MSIMSEEVKMTKEQKEWLKLCKILGLNGVELQFFLSLFYLPVEPKEKKKEVRNANTSLPGSKVR